MPLGRNCREPLKFALELNRFVLPRSVPPRFRINANGHIVETLRDLFDRDPGTVFYTQQLKILLEERFTYRETAEALRDLVRTHEITPIERQSANVSFYRHRRNRSYVANVQRAIQTLSKMSNDNFCWFLGRTGQKVAEAALTELDFSVVGTETRSYRLRTCSTTRADLDLIVERHSVGYGVEVKNRLDHIDLCDLKTKLMVSDSLGLLPIVVLRSAPSTHLNMVRARGGVAVELGSQVYSSLDRQFAGEVRERFGLPIIDIEEAVPPLVHHLRTVLILRYKTSHCLIRGLQPSLRRFFLSRANHS